MVTMVYRVALYFSVGIIALLLAMGAVYHHGYKEAELTCERETNELIIQHETEKNQILSQIRKKSPQERRKELSRYVMY